MPLPAYEKGNTMAVAITRGRISPQGSFLPSIDAIALPLLGRVRFPGTKGDGRGLITDAERLDRSPRPITGPSSYTRAVGSQRVGGAFPVHAGNLLG